MTTTAGIEVQELVANLDKVANALATVDARIADVAKGLGEIEDIATRCRQGTESVALLMIAEIARKLR